MRRLHIHHRHGLAVILDGVVGGLPVLDVRFQSALEIGSAHDGVYDGENDKDEGEDGKDGERFSCREVEFGALGLLVHAHEFEEEVGYAGEIEGL